MRVRIIQMFCESKCRDVYVIQKWMTKLQLPYQIGAPINETQRLWKEPEHWEPIRDFEIREYPQACDYAMYLSMEKKPVHQVVVFEDGAEVSNLRGCAPNSADHSYNSVRKSENCTTAAAGAESAPTG